MTTKDQLIEEICQQSFYMQDSRLVCNVKAALKRVSHSDVCALDLLIKLKMQDAVEKALYPNKRSD